MVGVLGTGHADARLLLPGTVLSSLFVSTTMVGAPITVPCIVRAVGDINFIFFNVRPTMVLIGAHSSCFRSGVITAYLLTEGAPSALVQIGHD